MKHPALFRLLVETVSFQLDYCHFQQTIYAFFSYVIFNGFLD